MNTTNSNVCTVQPFGDRLELYIASSISYGLGLLGSVILVRKILAEFSEANGNKRTIFSIFTAWIEFLVSSSLNNNLRVVYKIFIAHSFLFTGLSWLDWTFCKFSFRYYSVSRKRLNVS